MPKKTRLSKRDNKTIKEVLRGESFPKAMVKAGFKESTAKVKCGKKARELAPTIQALMEKKGLTDDRLLDVLDDGLRANKVISCNIIAPSGEGMADAHSMTKDFIDVDDHPTRHKFLETALKIKGHLREKSGVEINEQSLTLILGALPESYSTAVKSALQKQIGTGKQ